MSESRQTEEVNSSHRFSRALKIGIILLAASLTLILVAKYGSRFWVVNELAPPELGRHQLEVGEPPDPIHLDTIHLGRAERLHLLDGSFNIVVRMNDFTDSCKDIFESSFVSFSGSAVSPGQVKLADPGQAFEATDALQGGLPFRRLVFAGMGSKSCFVCYEKGGHDYPPTTCLAIMDYGQKKASWVGVSGEKVRSVKALRSLFVGGYFRDTGGPDC